MQVFKTFFIIIKDNILISAIYMILFLIITIVTSNSGETNINFEQVKVNVAFVNNDKDSAVVKGLYDVIEKNNEIVEIENNEEARQDALFHRVVEYILIVPEGFTEDFINNKGPKLEKLEVANSTSSIYMDMEINKYLNNAKLYKNYLDNKEINYADLALSDLNNESNVELKISQEKSTKQEPIDYYFIYSSYAVIGIVLLTVATFLMKFNKEEVKKRTSCSPIKRRKINMQILACIIIVAIIVWLIMLIIAFFLYNTQMFTAKAALHALNLLIYTILSTIIAFLAGSIIKKEFVLSGFVNVISLAFSFLGGTFVPQSMLGDKVLLMGSFTPTFWYVKAANLIYSIPDYTTKNLVPIFNCMLVVSLFSISLLMITLVINKQRKKNI